MTMPGGRVMVFWLSNVEPERAGSGNVLPRVRTVRQSGRLRFLPSPADLVSALIVHMPTLHACAAAKADNVELFVVSNRRTSHDGQDGAGNTRRRPFPGS